MAEFLQALWRALRPGPNAYLWLVALSPFFLWVGAVYLNRHLQRNVEPPQEEKLLRPPGYSLSLKFDETLESIFLNLIGASVMLIIAACSAAASSQLIGISGPMNYTAFFAGLLIVSAFPAGALLLRAWKKTIYLGNVRLGLRGEQAVAEALHELGDAGFRSFHDLQPEETWNIDHVAVGPQGVFLIDTKARRRRKPRGNQPKHVTIYDDKIIQLPFGADAKYIPQVERNCRWLASFLSKKTGEPVRVEGMVVMPGWWVEAADKSRNYPIKAMNAQYLVKYLRGKPSVLEPNQIRRIVAALDEECRTVEF